MIPCVFKGVEYQIMNDSLRENLSYFGIYRRLIKNKRTIKPERVKYGRDKQRYFLYYEPEEVKSEKIIVWVHGGGWNAGSPAFFDYVGQRIAGEGYRMISVGYRLSIKYKYPCQIRDVCVAYKAALKYLKGKGIDTSKVIVCGPSAGAHLTSIMCYSTAVQKRYDVDISNIVGFVGWGGPYSFRQDQTETVKILVGQLFRKGYDRRNGEPVSLMKKTPIPMLLIQSRHDGLIQYECAEEFAAKAERLGISCELYDVRDEKNTHSWYTAGAFMDTREENPDLDRFFNYLEEV